MSEDSVLKNKTLLEAFEARNIRKDLSPLAVVESPIDSANLTALIEKLLRPATDTDRPDCIFTSHEQAEKMGIDVAKLAVCDTSEKDEK